MFWPHLSISLKKFVAIGVLIQLLLVAAGLLLDMDAFLAPGGVQL
jgi:hypothetical protein